MAEKKNALAELAERLNKPTGFVEVYDQSDIKKASRIVAELAKYNINLIPQECYGC